MTFSSILFGVGLGLLVLFFVSLPFRERLYHSSGVTSSQRFDLMLRKAAVIAAIREIDADAQVGKLEPTDHRVLRQRYLNEGAQILKELDALPPGDEIDGRIQADIANYPERMNIVADGASFCGACGGQVDPNDRFCAHCGAQL